MEGEDSIKLMYAKLLVSLKQQINSAQAKAALAVNSSLIKLYWDLGKMIANNQILFEGSNSYVTQLAEDLRAEFPEMKGFSKRNIFYCRKFFGFYSGSSVQQLAALEKDDSIQQLALLNQDLFAMPWGHHVVLLDKTKSVEEALFYIQQTIEKNWSRAILIQQANRASQILKDPYNFKFITLESKVQELNVKRQLAEYITKFLLELGKGFGFVGRQYPLQVVEFENELNKDLG